MARLTPEQLKLFSKLMKEKGVETPERRTIPVRASADEAPLSFDQHRLWFLDRIEPGTSLYNDCVSVRLRGTEIDVDVFDRCVQEVVRRHEVLRTTFEELDGHPVQRVHAELRQPLELHDLQDLDDAGRAARLLEIQTDQVRTPFVLDELPLIRCSLVRMQKDEYVFAMTMHHIVSDGVSYGIFYQEITALYPAIVAGAPSPLEDLSVQFGDYAAWERDEFSKDQLDGLVEHWQGVLSGELPVLQLPVDNPRSDEARSNGAVHRFAFSQQLFADLWAYCRREDLTPYNVLLAGYAALLFRHSGQEDVLIGTPSSNRTHVDTEKLIGFFIHTIVVRLDLSENPSFRELVKRTRTSSSDAFEHQDIPFERLVSAVAPDRMGSRMPLIQAWFCHMKSIIPPLTLPGGTCEYEVADTGNSRFDLSVILDESETGIGGWIEFDTDLFAPTTIERFADEYEALLRHAIDHPDTSLRLLRETLAEAARRRRDAQRSTRRSGRVAGMKKIRKKTVGTPNRDDES